MAIDFASDLARARADVTTRYTDRRKAGIAAGSVEDGANTQDQSRLNLLDQLQNIYNDPTRRSQVAAAGKSQLDAAKLGLQYDWQQGGSQALSSAAGAGLLGSSHLARAKANLALTRDQATTQAATTAVDWQDQQNQADQQGMYQYLQQVLSQDPSIAGAQQTALQGQQMDWDLQGALAQNESQARARLSTALGSVLTNGIAPGIQAGFRTAQQNNTNLDRRNLGLPATTPVNGYSTWSNPFHW